MSEHASASTSDQRVLARAGLDIGNATTEVVLVDPAGRVVAADRTPTRGRKGSDDSIRGAAALLLRTARRADARLLRVITCEVRPVHTLTLSVPTQRTDTGPICVLTAGVPTPGGVGFGVGRPWDVTTERPYGPVIAVCPAGLHYREAVAVIRRALEESAGVRGVVVAGDDGVLIANRVPGLPVLDQVDTEAALAADVLAVEVSPAGHPPTVATDSFALASELGTIVTPSWQQQQVAAVAAELEGVSNCLVAVRTRPERLDPYARLPRLLWRYGWRHLDAREVGTSTVGDVSKLTVDGNTRPIADVSALDLDTLVADLRRATGASEVLLATLAAEDSLVDPHDLLASLLGVPVVVRRGADSEALAAQAGAWTTPGAAGALVVDLGAGTADVVPADGPPTVVAGSGDLLTTALAAVLGASKAIAEYAKRGPSVRVDQPHVVESEDGARRFIDPPLAGEVVGRLAVEGPVGFVALPGQWSPPEWRAVRRRAKAEVFGTAMRRSGATGRAVASTPMLLVGGPAADDEVVLAVSEVLGNTQPVGRGRVAAGRLAAGASVPRGTPPGSLGHRFAVAYGLTLDD